MKQKKVQREKLKILPPTLRQKDRYVAFQILSEYEITYSDLEAAIWNTMLDFFGEYGLSKMNMWVVKNLYDEQRQIGVIRCNNLAVQQVIAGLGLISRLGDCRIAAKIFKVSGTIKGLR
jgi:ribonuclease P/MRP protein subunit POP5